MLTIFLGAGFSVVGGVPLASQLFERKPIVDRITRQNLVERVHNGWVSWQARTGGQPEEYLAYLKHTNDRRWKDAVWYVGLLIALATARVERVGLYPEVTRHNINRTTSLKVHEDFWSIIFRRTKEVVVVTTNYDILPERGIRNEPRPRVPRPGFNYGDGPEELFGGGYPSFAHIQKIEAKGSVQLLKLHGSVSWSIKDGELIRYHDCRPAIRGDPAIIAPVTTKELPPQLEPIWEKAESALSSSKVWIIVGYSLPEYDLLVRDLLQRNSVHKPHIHIFNPNQDIASRFEQSTAFASISSHPGLPNGLKNLARFMDTIERE